MHNEWIVTEVDGTFKDPVPFVDLSRVLEGGAQMEGGDMVGRRGWGLGMILSAHLLIRSLACTDVAPKQIITDEVTMFSVVPMY